MRTNMKILNRPAMAIAATLCCIATMSTAATPPATKATLKHAELNQTLFAAPGNITVAAMLTGDKGSGTNCNFNASIVKLTDSGDAINPPAVSGVKLTGSLPGLVGPVPANVQPGKYRVDFAVDSEATSACKGSVSANFEVKRQALNLLPAAPASPPAQKPPSPPMVPVVVAPNAPVPVPVPVPAPAPPPPPQKAALKHAELNQTSFSAPGNITIAAMLTGDKGSSTNCNFNANIWQIADGADAINLAVVSGVKLTGSLPGLVGPVPANLQHGKYRVDFAVDNEATSACKGSVSANFEVKRQTLAVGTPSVAAKIINVTPDSPAVGIDEPLKFYVLAEVPAKCDKMTVSIDDKKMDLQNISFPYTLDIKHTDSMYPKTGGKHNLTVSGSTTNCKGSASAVFGTKIAPAPVVEPPQVGLFDNFSFTGLPNVQEARYFAGQPLQMDIRGNGVCQLDISIKNDDGALLRKQRVTAKFPYHYVSDINMPPYGWIIDGTFLPIGVHDKSKSISVKGAFTVTVTPVTSAGPPAQVCVGQGRVADYKTRCEQQVCEAAGAGNGPATKSKATSLKVSGFSPDKADGKIELGGTGMCDVRITVFNLKGAHPIVDLISINKENSKLALPVVRDNLGPLSDGTYRAYALTDKSSQCVVQGPNASAQGWYVDFKVGTGTGAGSTGNGTGGGSTGGATPPGGYVPPAPKAANGNVVSLQVPGGSFAEDDPQKLQVNGTGGCAMDLRIWNTSYGGNFDKTFDVKPMALAGSPMLYNGTHFDTLAEGSYSAAVKGKGGCTGNPTVDFKVTAKTSTAVVKGKPTLSLDKQPQAGGAFSKSKDSNIWFKVALPPSIKGTQYATCCDVEFNYKNSYGGWEVLPGSPFSDSSWANAMTLPSVATAQSVSGFKQGTEWRMKVRGAKFKTTFDWSDWLEFKVDQN